MASLTGTKIKDTYDSLLKVSDNGALDGTLQTITDGLGNNSALSLSTAGASVGGTLAVSGAATLSGGVSGNVAFDTDTLFVDSSNNKVGVGTASPAEKLSVAGAIISTGSITGHGANRVSISQEGASGAFFQSYGANTSTMGSFVFRQASSDFSVTNIPFSIAAGGDISFRDSSANEAFYWDASAARLSLGAGSAPTTKLDVVSSDLNNIFVTNPDTSGATTGSGIGFKAYNGSSVAQSAGIILTSNTWSFGTYSANQLSVGADGTGGLALRTANSAPITFFTGGATAGVSTERMRITSEGYLKASNDGSYSGAGSNHVMKNITNGNTITNFYHSGTDPYGLFAYFDGSSPNNTSNYFAYFRDVTEAKFIVYSNGNVVNLNNSYGAISDAKLKENVTDASPKLEDLMQVKVRNFNYIGDDKKQLGVVAQELEEVFPSMIDESPDYEEVEVPQLDENGQEVLDENGEVVMTKEKVDLGTVTKSVKYSVFVPMLIKAIQELNAKVESLEAQLNA